MTREEMEKKLNALPWQALFDLAISYKITEDEVKGKDKLNIINRLLALTDIDENTIDSIVTEYIYGSRITFTLWSFERTLNDTEYNTIIAFEGITEETLGIKGFRNMHFLSIKKHEDRLEIIYEYCKEYSFINEAGKNDSVWELHRGSAWIGLDKVYIACISKHDQMTSCFLSYLKIKLNINILQILPPKSALERCITILARSRITLQKLDGGRTIISNSDGLTPDQEEEMERIRAGRFDTSGSYIANITENTSATIKYNVKKGSIGIYKHLSSNDLFKWTHQAITIILDEIELLKGQPAETIFDKIGIPLTWNFISNENNGALNWLLTQIITAQAKRLNTQVIIPDFVKSILLNNRLFIRIPRIYCERCEAYDIPRCHECGLSLNMIEGQLKCSCGAPTRICCGEGHLTCHPDDWFVPTEKLKQEIQKNYMKAFQGHTLNYNMCIMGSTLIIDIEGMNNNLGEEISFDAVEEFKRDQKKDLTKCLDYVVKLKEKCGKTCSYSKISECTISKQSVCIPKLFWGIINGFRPQPHKGTEYGDVSGKINVNGIDYEFVGIVKSNTKNKGAGNQSISILQQTPLLSTSKEAQEMIRQFVEQGLCDSRCEIIALIAPQYFDASFKGTLRFLARLGNKKILFIELEQLAR